jgi:hypothetical protein
MTVKKHTPSGAQSSTSARNHNHPARPARQKGKGRGSKGKQSATRLRDADELTAERIRAILSDPNTPSRVAGKLQSLVNKLGELTDAPAPDTADFYADTFLYAAETVRGGMPNTPDERAEAAPLYADVARYAERHEPEGYRLARRVSEIFAEAKARGDREDFIMQAADEVTTSGGEGVMLSSPASEFFVQFFVNAARDLSPKYRALVELKAIVARYDAGATLREMVEEEEARGRERTERHKAAQLEKPEPKDRLSDEWRYWKLRQIEHAFGPACMEEAGAEAYSAAHRYFRELLTGLFRDENFYNVAHILPLLPQLIIARQELDRTDRYERRSAAGAKGTETRKANKAKAAKKGGAK